MEIRDLHLFSFPCLRLHSKYLDSSLSLLSTSSIGLSQDGQCLFEARHPCSWRNETTWFDVLVASIIWNIVKPVRGVRRDWYGVFLVPCAFFLVDLTFKGDSFLGTDSSAPGTSLNIFLKKFFPSSFVMKSTLSNEISVSLFINGDCVGFTFSLHCWNQHIASSNIFQTRLLNPLWSESNCRKK